MPETFHGEWHADHPVRWESHGSADEVAYLSLDEAALRIARINETDVDQVRETLTTGARVQTWAAHYQLVEEGS